MRLTARWCADSLFWHQQRCRCYALRMVVDIQIHFCVKFFGAPSESFSLIRKDISRWRWSKCGYSLYSSCETNDQNYSTQRRGQNNQKRHTSMHLSPSKNDLKLLRTSSWRTSNNLILAAPRHESDEIRDNALQLRSTTTEHPKQTLHFRIKFVAVMHLHHGAPE